MIRIETDRLIIRESSGRDFSRIYAMLLSGRRKAGESLDLSGTGLVPAARMLRSRDTSGRALRTGLVPAARMLRTAGTPPAARRIPPDRNS